MQEMFWRDSEGVKIQMDEKMHKQELEKQIKLIQSKKEALKMNNEGFQKFKNIAEQIAKTE